MSNLLIISLCGMLLFWWIEKPEVSLLQYGYEWVFAIPNDLVDSEHLSDKIIGFVLHFVWASGLYVLLVKEPLEKMASETEETGGNATNDD